MNWTQSDTTILEEAAVKFLGAKTYSFSPTTGGVNNVVRYIDTEDGNKFILRVYNNGNNSYRVRFEHAILQQLADMKLSFKIPTSLPSIDSGSSHVLLSNGAEASLFQIIPGVLPKLTMVKEIGQASGELTSALAKVQLDLASPTPPYYELYKVHHAVTRENFLETVVSSDFDSIREVTNELVEEVNAIEALARELLDLQLPQQLIHGDLHYDNVLVVDDGVSGLLDFEFCAYDWRAMELAICLSKYAGEKDAVAYFNQFIEGYMEHAQLSPLEIAVVPDLINLRILSNVVYFVGRAIAREDSITSLTIRAQNYLNRIKWIKANREVITSKIEACLVAKTSG
jgi:homoserine kinase type II